MLVVGCSFGRGQADELSDLDTNMGVADEAWAAFFEDVDVLARQIGDLVDVLHHQIPELGELPHRRTFAQYRDGVQLDLVIQPVSYWTRGRTPDMVVLSDPDGRARRVVEPSNLRASINEVREWAFLGWAALADCAKYIRRGSLWEALDHLHEARHQAWRLWAVSKGVPQPVYGLTSILDTPGTDPPLGIASSAPHLNRGELVAAALVCAELVDRASSGAMTALGSSQERSAIASWVQSQLDSIRRDG